VGGFGVVEAECEGSFGDGAGAVHLVEEGGVGVFHADDAVGELGAEESGEAGLASEVEAESCVWGGGGGVLWLRLVLFVLWLWFGGLCLRLWLRLLRYVIDLNYASRWSRRLTGGVVGGIHWLLPRPFRNLVGVPDLVHKVVLQLLRTLRPVPRRRTGVVVRAIVTGAVVIVVSVGGVYEIVLVARARVVPFGVRVLLFLDISIAVQPFFCGEFGRGILGSIYPRERDVGTGITAFVT